MIYLLSGKMLRPLAYPLMGIPGARLRIKLKQVLAQSLLQSWHWRAILHLATQAYFVDLWRGVRVSSSKQLSFIILKNQLMSLK